MNTSNNVGASLWPANAESFDAATESLFDCPVPSPRGLAFAPGGKLLFAACYGIGDGEGNKVMVIDHNKALRAVKNDAGDGSYNLTGSSPESLDDMNGVSGYEDTVRYATGFDGPRSVALQEFPIVQAGPTVVHLATGGVANYENMVSLRVHPVYGDTVKVGLADGSSVTLESYSWSTSPNWRRQDLGVNRDVFELEPVGTVPPLCRLDAARAGVGKAIADVEGHPSNPVFVTVPPQKFIQVLFGEACHSANELTYRSLAAVVKNRIRLTKRCFVNPDVNSKCIKFEFPNPGQLLGRNSSEEKATVQITSSLTKRHFDSVGNTRYEMASSRSGIALGLHKEKYDICVKVAGAALLDLTRTTTDDTDMYQIPRPDPNYLDILDDPTGGSFFFYSPTNSEWGDSTSGILGALLSGDTTFPDAGDFESDRICSIMAPSFCYIDPVTEIKSANYLQVVVVNGIPQNNCSGTLKENAPQFIFIRWRDINDPSVVELP